MAHLHVLDILVVLIIANPTLPIIQAKQSISEQTLNGCRDDSEVKALCEACAGPAFESLFNLCCQDPDVFSKCKLCLSDPGTCTSGIFLDDNGIDRTNNDIDMAFIGNTNKRGVTPISSRVKEKRVAGHLFHADPKTQYPSQDSPNLTREPPNTIQNYKEIKTPFPLTDVSKPLPEKGVRYPAVSKRWQNPFPSLINLFPQRLKLGHVIFLHRHGQYPLRPIRYNSVLATMKRSPWRSSLSTKSSAYNAKVGVQNLHFAQSQDLLKRNANGVKRAGVYYGKLLQCDLDNSNPSFLSHVAKEFKVMPLMCYFKSLSDSKPDKAKEKRRGKLDLYPWRGLNLDHSMSNATPYLITLDDTTST